MNDRYKQPERWIASGLSHLGQSIAVAGLLVALGIAIGAWVLADALR